MFCRIQGSQWPRLFQGLASNSREKDCPVAIDSLKEATLNADALGSRDVNSTAPGYGPIAASITTGLKSGLPQGKN